MEFGVAARAGEVAGVPNAIADLEKAGLVSDLLDNPGSIAYILADCEASLLIVEQRTQWERIRDVGTALPALQGGAWSPKTSSQVDQGKR